jgi:hypothetical protein
MASRIRRREVRYLGKLAAKYRINEILDTDSPFNASVISIPLPIPDIAIPMPIPDLRPVGFSKEGPPPNLFNHPSVEKAPESTEKSVTPSRPESLLVTLAVARNKPRHLREHALSQSKKRGMTY